MPTKKGLVAFGKKKTTVQNVLVISGFGKLEMRGKTFCVTINKNL